ncbi:MAG: ADP-ribosylation factor-like protein [Promethearchaeota archaeon]
MNKIVLCGLNNAGKTSIMKVLVEKVFVKEYIPSVVCGYEELNLKDKKFIIFDCPGQKAFRNIWLDQIKNASLLIYVLDIANKDRFKEAREEFYKIVNIYLEARGINRPILFLLHKTDLASSKENIDYAIKYFNLSSSNLNLFVHYTSIYMPPTLFGLMENIYYKLQ